MDYISTQPAKDTVVMFFQWKHVELGASPVAHLIKNLPVSAGDIRDVGSIPGQEDPLEEGMATHSIMLAWRIPWIEEPSRLQSIGLHIVRRD